MFKCRVLFAIHFSHLLLIHSYLTLFFIFFFFLKLEVLFSLQQVDPAAFEKPSFDQTGFKKQKLPFKGFQGCFSEIWILILLILLILILFIM